MQPTNWSSPHTLVYVPPTTYLRAPLTKGMLRGFAAASRLVANVDSESARYAVLQSLVSGDAFQTEFSRGLMLGVLSAWGMAP